MRNDILGGMFWAEIMSSGRFNKLQRVTGCYIVHFWQDMYVCKKKNPVFTFPVVYIESFPVTENVSEVIDQS